MELNILITNSLEQQTITHGVKNNGFVFRTP